MTQTDNGHGHGLSVYRQAFWTSKGIHIVEPNPDQSKQSKPDNLVPEPENRLVPGAPSPPIIIFDDRGDLTTPRRPGNDNASPQTFHDITHKSTSQNNEQHLVIVNEVDDAYSEASERFRANRSRYAAPSWRRRRGQQAGSDSDKSEKGGAPDGEAEAYDSDLDSAASRERPGQGGVARTRPSREHAKKMWKWRSQAANRYENMLLECIVNTDSIPPAYADIFVDTSTIRQLERVTTLSLERKRAFSSGVLKGNRVTGAILWGPPGTGKSLLAKSMARESGYNMLAISTAELWQKCHGEDEKVIKAVFSLGRKLHPCIVFVDEADAMLGSRKAGEKRHLRSMLNQFLLDWDGLMTGSDSPFVLLATNRPFDLDPAVLRRAPVQIKLDVPTQGERQGILQLLLKHEKLEKGCEPDVLARLTNRYTGSDLKNLCVTAATLCVEEQHDDTEVRTLGRHHFRKAMETIRPTALNATTKNELQRFGGVDIAHMALPGQHQHDEDD